MHFAREIDDLLNRGCSGIAIVGAEGILPIGGQALERESPACPFPRRNPPITGHVGTRARQRDEGTHLLQHQFRIDGRSRAGFAAIMPVGGDLRFDALPHCG